jgi:hypothetical protein
MNKSTKQNELNNNSNTYKFTTSSKTDIQAMDPNMHTATQER